MKDFVRFYTEYDEDGRIQSRHRVEFASTTYVLDKYIPKYSHILDIGAGTGAYSLYYAEKGCSVVAVDAVPKHIEILRSKLQSQPNLDIQVHLADIRDLSLPLQVNFDVVLFMGPIYHMPQQDINRCLDTCLQVLKKDGILAVSYVNTYEGYERNRYLDAFIYHSYADIEQLLSKFNLTPICHVPTDGEVFGEFNALAQEKQEEITKLHTWLDKNQSVLHDPQWVSKCIHGLFVSRKR